VGELSPNRDQRGRRLHALTGDSHITALQGPGDEQGMVGRGRRTRCADRHRPLVCGIRHERAWRLPRARRRPSSRARTESRAGSRFPRHVGARDQVAGPKLAALEAMGYHRGGAVVGGSMGGARQLEVDRHAHTRRGRSALVLRRRGHAQRDQISAPRAQRSQRSSPTRTGVANAF